VAILLSKSLQRVQEIYKDALVFQKRRRSIKKDLMKNSRIREGLRKIIIQLMREMNIIPKNIIRPVKRKYRWMVFARFYNQCLRQVDFMMKIALINHLLIIH